jgi:hypothetical protein
LADKANVQRDSSSKNWIESRADPAPWHPVDQIEPEDIDNEEVERLSAFNPEVIGSLMRIVFVPDIGRGVDPRAVIVKLFALAHALHIEGVGDKPLEHWAQKIGCTRSLLSFYTTRIRDRAALDCRAGKSVLARDRLAAVALWNTSRRDGTRAKKNKAGGAS